MTLANSDYPLLDVMWTMDGAAEQQQLLGQRRLARVGMRDDGERPPQAGGMAGQAGVEIGDDGGIGHFLRTFEGCEGVADPSCGVNPARGSQIASMSQRGPFHAC